MFTVNSTHLESSVLCDLGQSLSPLRASTFSVYGTVELDKREPKAISKTFRFSSHTALKHPWSSWSTFYLCMAHLPTRIYAPLGVGEGERQRPFNIPGSPIVLFILWKLTWFQLIESDEATWLFKTLNHR